jgi:hypothetical protein
LSGIATDPRCPRRRNAHDEETAGTTARQTSPGTHVRRAVIVVDQFEELFTADIDDTDRHAFVHALVAASTGTSSDDGTGDVSSGSDEPPAIVVLGLRADFYGRATEYPELAATLTDGQVVVGPMTRGELSDAIRRPARKPVSISKTASSTFCFAISTLPRTGLGTRPPPSGRSIAVAVTCSPGHLAASERLAAYRQRLRHYRRRAPRSCHHRRTGLCRLDDTGRNAARRLLLGTRPSQHRRG